jgi:hypothetical protein
VDFEILGPISAIETIASRRSLRKLRWLRERYGGRRWRKVKGMASIRLVDGEVRRAEIHWYEAHGIGRVLHKIKRFVD